jgi:Mn-dependent DtxR family transcriptional regulator
MTPTRDEILAAVNAEPVGITSADLARKLGSTAYSVSGTLSKLCAYGLIDRQPTTRNGAYLWHKRGNRS